MAFQTSERAQSSATDAIAALLRDLIDYAGSFPPASLSMGAAVTNYDLYAGSEWNWMLGRFIVPVARLGEFETALAELPTVEGGTRFAQWRLSALLGSDPVADVERLREFNSRGGDAGGSGGAGSGGRNRSAVVQSVEVKIGSADEITRLSAAIPPEFATYFEVPLSACGECIAAVAVSGRRAKIRTGGETADKFPASESVVEFIRQCAAAHVPFKATAGLHHPLRSVRRLTYAPDSPSGMMHGFLNVFLTAAFLRAGMDPALAVQLLEERSAEAFRFDGDGVAWREHRLGWDSIAAAREGFAVSFGSCSFVEPVEDLRSLHWLENTGK